MHHNSAGDFWNLWQISPEILLLITVLALAFRRKTMNPTSGERIAFYTGLLSIPAVVNSPIGALATTYFWCHMLQHMTLMMLTGPLLVMGTVNHWRFQSSIWRWVSNPWRMWFVYAALMIGVHFTSLHEFLMMKLFFHNFIEVPAYILVSYIFYYHILDGRNNARVLPPGLAVLMLFLMMVPETLTGFFIYAAPHSLYSEMYSLNDQRLGGALMWSGSMIIDAIWLSVAVRDWLRSEEVLSRKIDEEIAREKKR